MKFILLLLAAIASLGNGHGRWKREDAADDNASSPCGVQSPSSSFTNSSGNYIVYAVADNEIKWNKNPVNYTFENFTSTLSPSEVRAAVKRAFDLWASVIPLTFAEVTGVADIRITFKPIGGNVVGLAQNSHDTVFFIGSEITFDNEQIWGNASPPKYDLVAVAIHEIGHAIGLPHSTDNASVMTSGIFSTTDANGNYLPPKLAQSDIANIQKLYGQRTPTPTPTPAPLYKASLFENINHLGAQLDLSASDTTCRALPANFLQKVSSVHGRAGCILLYSGAGCTGQQKIIVGNCQGSECCSNHKDLASCSFDNAVSSYAFCNPNSTPAPAPLYKASLFENINHQGAQLDLSASDTACRALPSNFLLKTSSVHGRDGCILLYSGAGCQGQRKIIVGNCQGSECCSNHRDLTSCNFDNTVSSYAFCNPSATPAPLPLYKASLFENINHQGPQLDLSASDTACREIPANFLQKTSSVHGRDGCILLYSEAACSGRRKIIASNCHGNSDCCSNHFDMASCIFDNTAKSYAFCNPSATPAAPPPLYKASLFENINHLGAQLDLSASDTTCRALPANFLQKVSSVHGRAGCILLYSGAGCTGQRKIIVGNCQGSECCNNHKDLASCSFDNAVSSYAFC